MRSRHSGFFHKETQEMLDFWGEHYITSDIEVIVMREVNEAYERVVRDDVRYRFVIDCGTLGAGVWFGLRGRSRKRLRYIEDLRRSERYTESGNRERTDFVQTGIAGVKAPGVGIDEPDVPHAPGAIFLELFADGGEAVVGREYLNGYEWRRVGY